MSDDKKGLRDISRKSEDVAHYYDEFAPNYNDTLKRWQYDTPQKVAALLKSQCNAMDSAFQVLDVGCGTGLTGQALRDIGFQAVDGIDISDESLVLAEQRGCYRQLQKIDLQKFPYSIDSNHYDAITCVGVFTYLPDSENTLREFCRVVKTGGLVIVTQRTDLFVERQFDRVLHQLQDSGVLTDLNISEPRPYLPKQEEFADKILIHYIQFRAGD